MNDSSDIMVSVKCMTYNHGKFIRQALEGIVTQKTNFKFEVIVHDDASTDGTAEIVKEYAEKYPDLIKATLQKENQYSKRINISMTYMYPAMKGKYVAVCEGDDYWTDTNKLQKQVDYMEAHPKCTLCIHNADIVDVNGKKTGEIKACQNSGIVSCDNVILGGGGFCATNSIMFPRYLIADPPDYIVNFGIDLVWQMFLAGKGETYCFSDFMSAYRSGVPGSWTERTTKSGGYAQVYDKIIAFRERFDEETSYKYHEAIKQSNEEVMFNKMIVLRDFKLLKEEPYKSVLKKKSKRERFRLSVIRYFPGVFPVISNIYQKINCFFRYKNRG